MTINRKDQLVNDTKGIPTITDQQLDNYRDFWKVSFETALQDFLKDPTELKFHHIGDRQSYASQEQKKFYLEFLHNSVLKKEKTEGELILLGDAYYKGLIEKSYTNAIACFKQCQSPWSFYLIARVCYWEGMECQDAAKKQEKFNEAKVLFEEAKSKGSYTAASRLGEMYTNGFGVMKDPLEAEKQFLYAAQGKLPIAYLKLYGLYREIIKNPAKAFTFLYQGIASGLPDCLVQLGNDYSVGDQGLSKDKERAMTYYKMACDQHYALAYLKLADEYIQSLKNHMPDEYFKIVQIYKKALKSTNDLDYHTRFITQLKLIPIASIGNPGAETIYYECFSTYDEKDPECKPVTLELKDPSIKGVHAALIKFKENVLKKPEFFADLVLKEENPIAVMRCLTYSLNLSVLAILFANKNLVNVVLKNPQEEKSPLTGTLVKFFYPELSHPLQKKLDALTFSWESFIQFIQTTLASGPLEDIKEIIQLLLKTKNIDATLFFQYSKEDSRSGSQITSRPTALSVAVEHGRLDVVRELLNAGANPAEQVADEVGVLREMKQVVIHKTLPCFIKPSPPPSTPTHCAVRSLHLDIVKELITALLKSNPANLQTILNDALFAIMFSYKNLSDSKYSQCRIEISKQLIQTGANPNCVSIFSSLDTLASKDQNQVAAIYHFLHDAIANADAEFVEYLLKQIKYPSIVIEVLDTHWAQRSICFPPTTIQYLIRNKNSYEQIEKIIFSLLDFLLANKLNDTVIKKFTSDTLCTLSYSELAISKKMVDRLVEHGADLASVNQGWLAKFDNETAECYQKTLPDALPTMPTVLTNIVIDYARLFKTPLKVAKCEEDNDETITANRSFGR